MIRKSLWFLIVLDCKNIDLAQYLSSSSSFKRNLTEGILNCFKNSSLAAKYSKSNMAEKWHFSSVDTLLFPISVINLTLMGHSVPKNPGRSSFLVHFLLRHIDSWDVLVLFHKTIHPFLFKRQGLWRGPLCGSVHKSWQSVPSCMCVKHCHGVITQCLSFCLFFFFFFLGLLNQWATWWKSIFAFRLVAGTFGLYHAGICWEKPNGRYLRQPSQALYNELSKCHHCIILMLIKIYCLHLYFVAFLV